MENSGGNRNAPIVILLFAILMGVGVFGFVILAQVNRVTDPIEAVSGEAATQLAELLNATPTILPDPVTIIRDVRTLARLETIQYSLEKVITAETGQGPFGFLFGDRLLFVAHGDVIAGVDLAKLQAGDMWVEGETLMVRLPEAEIFIAALDNDKSYVYDRDVGILTGGNVGLETEARQVAEDEILNAALEDGILDQARINAESFLLRLLIDLGYPDVEFVGPEEN